MLEMALVLKDLHQEHPPMTLKRHQGEFASCSACWIQIVDTYYSCSLESCSHRLHKSCGESGQLISSHPLHGHPLQLHYHYSRSPITRACGICEIRFRDRASYYYECDESGCRQSFHFQCVLLSLDHHTGTKLKHDAYPLPLALFQNHTEQLNHIDCISCHEPLVDSIYVSEDFKLFLHHKCVELFTGECYHPFHREHLLVLNSYHQDPMLCEICQQEHPGLSYHCSLCDFNVHVACAWPDRIVKVASRHEHPFHLFWRQDSFVCDACGTEGRYCSYACFECHYQVHPTCTSLPRNIKVTRHYSHPLSHNYFVPKQQELIGKQQVCQFCFQEVKTRHGCYYCSKPVCDYIAHVKCALEFDVLFDIVDSPKDSSDQEDEEIIETSITHILEVDENGDAVKVEHWFHEHCLTLGDTINDEKDDKYCDGRMQYISAGPFFYCSECDFFLHKSCAELPMKRNHFFSLNLFELDKGKAHFNCDRCSRICSGFVYECDLDDSDSENTCSFCLNCANISDTLMHPDHEHLLFYDMKCQGRCNCCGDDKRPLGENYRCTQNCNFILDLGCITLPREVRHRCDTHLLKLASSDGIDDPTQCYCDICEELRDPNQWLYHCSVCDTSVHRECALGKYPFIKIGSKLEEEKVHEHPLTFVQKNYYYPECAKCHKLCPRSIS